MLRLPLPTWTLRTWVTFPLKQWRPATSSKHFSQMLSGWISDTHSILWHHTYATIPIWTGITVPSNFFLNTAPSESQDGCSISLSDPSVMDTRLHSERNLSSRKQGQLDWTDVPACPIIIRTHCVYLKDGSIIYSDSKVPAQNPGFRSRGFITPPGGV